MAISILIAATCAPSLAQTTNNLSPAQWQQDLSFLVTQIEKLHPAAFKYVGHDQFERQVKELQEKQPTLNRDETIVSLMSLVAGLGDGHTTVMPAALRAIGMKSLPMRFFLYQDGVYLQAADARYKSAVGGKLLRIGTVPADEAVRRLDSLVSHDNQFTVLDRLPTYLIFPDLLSGLHIIERPDRVTLIFGVRGQEITVEAEPVNGPALQMGIPIDVSYSDSWIDWRQAEPPLYLKRTRQPYWMEYLPDSKTLYVQYNQCTSDPQKPMSQFAAEMRTALAQPNVERAVLDLRLNSGGEGYWNKFLLLNFIRSTNIDQKGKLFVMIGPRTFSAGSVLAIDMERFTNATFVGMPTGGAVQNFGNHEPVVLPNSHLAVMVATKYYQNDGPNDERPYIAPEVAAEMTQQDYERGVDPAWTAILNYKPLAERLRVILAEDSPATSRQRFDQFKSQPINRYANLEPALIDVGYGFLRAGDNARAVETFRIASEDHPHSANAFDSLGDAYLATGDKQKAIESYEHALQIAPNWEPSRRSLAKLRGEPTGSRASH